MLNRRLLGGYGAGLCFGFATVCVVFLFGTASELTIVTLLNSQLFFGAFILLFAGVGGLLVYRFSPSGSDANMSSEKKSEPQRSGSSETLEYIAYPPGCKVLEANMSSHTFESEIVLYLPKGYAKSKVSEDSNEAKEEEKSIFGDVEE